MLLISEHNMDVKTIIKELLKTHAALEKTEQQLKNTKLDLERATRELEDGTDLYLSGSVPKLYPPISKWPLIILILKFFSNTNNNIKCRII